MPRSSRAARARQQTTAPTIWPAVALVPFAAAAGWIVWSHFGIDHDVDMIPPLPGRQSWVDGEAGRTALFADGPAEGTPLLLLHSVNAAANAFEVEPFYNHYRKSRPVYALELPGFGFSDRWDKTYTPRLMTDAIHAAVAHIRSRHGDSQVDTIALSLTCEYLARAAIERPSDHRSLGLVTPTGFDRALAGEGPAGANRGNPVLLDILSVPLWKRPLFDLLVSRPSIRKFLEKAWGSTAISERLLTFDGRAAHQPGAEHAPISFIAGYLFADDVTRIYKLLKLPVWTCHGTRGDFTDFRREAEIAGKPNWHFSEYDTGAFPHFEDLRAVTADYDAFVATLDAES